MILLISYIDSEGSFRPERIQEIARAGGLHPKQILQRILVTKALDIKHKLHNKNIEVIYVCNFEGYNASSQRQQS